MILFVFTTVQTFAQDKQEKKEEVKKEKAPKEAKAKAKKEKGIGSHEIHYHQLDAFETDEYKLEITNAHSQVEFTNLKLKITNKTADYLIYKPSEVVFKYEQGDFKTTGKDVIIQPKDVVTRTLRLTGERNFHVEKVSVIADCFYRLPTDKELLSAPDFDLPATKNDFKAGAFDVSLKKLSKETQETQAHFIITYMGNDYGILTAGIAVIKLEDGKEFASVGSKVKSKVLRPGDKRKMTLAYKVPASVTDMQFANMKIVWKNTFVESKAVKIAGQTLNFVIDPGLTEGKN